MAWQTRSVFRLFSFFSSWKPLECWSISGNIADGAEYRATMKKNRQKAAPSTEKLVRKWAKLNFMFPPNIVFNVPLHYRYSRPLVSPNQCSNSFTSVHWDYRSVLFVSFFSFERSHSRALNGAIFQWYHFQSTLMPSLSAQWCYCSTHYKAIAFRLMPPLPLLIFAIEGSS